jgi:hypothetical protein
LRLGTVADDLARGVDAEALAEAISLYIMFMNFTRPHKSLANP